MDKTFADLFSGAGGVAEGAKQAGFTHAWGLEFEDPLAEIYRVNHGQVYVQNILDANPMKFEKVDLLHASPVCKSYSTANPNKGEKALDIACAHKVAEFIQVLEPYTFTLENVQAYATAKDNKAFNIILKKLYSLGYCVNYNVLNAADFGVPQSRRRLILIATKDGFIPSLPPKEKHIGWYEAIADKVHNLPDTQLAKWQIKKLENLDWYKHFIARQKESWYNSGIELANFGDQNEETFAAKVLQKLWERNDEETLRKWSVGVLEGFQPTSILQYDLFCKTSNSKGTLCSKEQGKLSLLFEKIGHRWGLRNLWESECNRCSSQRWGLDEQFFREFAAYLSQLSYEGTQSETNLLCRWLQFDNDLQRILQQTLSSFQEIWRSSLHENKTDGRHKILHQNGKIFKSSRGKENMGYFKQSAFQESENKTPRADIYKTILIENTGARSDRGLQIRQAEDPCWTLRAMGKDGHWHRANALLENTSIKALDIACLARLQSFPDNYQWSGKKSLDGKGIGNSVPPLMYQKLVLSLINGV